MHRLIVTLFVLGAMIPSVRAQQEPTAGTAPSPEEQAVRERTAALVATFNKGDADAVAGLFLPDAELVDEEGTLHRGREQIADLLRRFFEAYPGAVLSQDIELVRTVGPDLAIEDGTRTISTSEGDSVSRSRYLVVWRRQDDGSWQVASARQYQEEPPSPHERLLPLAWMVGEWIDESQDSLIRMSCKWSEDGNYLLRDFQVTVEGLEILNTTQRLGWDPLKRKIKSWAFDSDGGTAEGEWTEIDGRWVVKTTAVLPDGTTASGTIIYQPIDDDSFQMRGVDRIVGDEYEPDFEVTVVRKAPEPTSR